MVFALGKGLIFGFGMSLMLGTVFFSLIQNSIVHGWKKGILIASGVVFSDFLFISLAVLGVQFIQPEEKNVWIYAAAVILLSILGINLLLDKKKKVSYPESKFGKALYLFSFVSNGFLLNVLNPVNFLFWASIAAVARTTWAYETPQLLSFFSGCLISIFCTEVLISFLAHRIKPYLNDKVLIGVNRVTALVFLGIAAYLVFDFFN
ncbi:MAG: LysE family translocator [Bacteroidota bacterium]|nr:LysE family translocator [Bacteroidota bacterium]MDX5429628.1 LysE family translocator [Bacteroidota bacterium]MDX5468412.1 LysE family translocator [Bacteroidota bacterium]